MKNHLLKTAGALGVIVAMTGIAHASTFNLGDGDSICEGPPALLPAVCAEDGLDTFTDGPQAGTGPSATINFTFSGSGHATIYGGIRGRNDSQYQDVFDLTGSGAYRLTLTALEFRDDEDFDADWTLGGNLIGEIDNTNTTLTTLVSLSGAPTLFNLDAAGGDFANGSVMEYELKVEAVPLPAGVVLLLSGLGGLAFMRRRARS